jgi:hypothetical protein
MNTVMSLQVLYNTGYFLAIGFPRRAVFQGVRMNGNLGIIYRSATIKHSVNAYNFSRSSYH